MSRVRPIIYLQSHTINAGSTHTLQHSATPIIRPFSIVPQPATPCPTSHQTHHAVAIPSPVLPTYKMTSFPSPSARETTSHLHLAPPSPYPPHRRSSAPHLPPSPQPHQRTKHPHVCIYPSTPQPQKRQISLRTPPSRIARCPQPTYLPTCSPRRARPVAVLLRWYDLHAGGGRRWGPCLPAASAGCWISLLLLLGGGGELRGGEEGG